MITPIGIVFIFLTIIAILINKKFLFYLLTISAFFPAASIINLVGDFDFGITPYYFVGLIIVFLNLNNLQNALNFRGHNFIAVVATILFVWSTISMSFPLIFPDLYVLNPRDGIDSAILDKASLHITTSAIAQLAYLFINVSILLIVCEMKDRLPKSNLVFKYSNLILIIICAIQVTLAYLGYKYDNSIINNNIGISQSISYDYAGLQRIYGSFTEASTLSGYSVCGMAFFMLKYLKQNRIFTSSYFFFLSLFLVTFLSTSTTGISVLFIIYTVLFLVFISYLIRRHLNISKILSIKVFLVVIPFILIIIALITQPILINFVQESVIDKPKSGSFFSRTNSDLYSLELFMQTYGLGTGLGTNRPSSFLTYVLSNIGLVGFVLLATLIFKIIVISGKNFVDRVSNPYTMAILIYIIAKIIAIPDLNAPIFWILLFLSIISSRRMDIPVKSKPQMFYSSNDSQLTRVTGSS